MEMFKGVEMRIIDLDKLETYFKTTNIQRLKTLAIGAISTLNIVDFLLGLKQSFEDNVTITIAGKEFKDLANEKLLPVIFDAKKNYDNISLYFHLDDKLYSVVYMYDEDSSVWIKALTSANIVRDYVFETRFIQQVCQDNHLELNPYSFDVIFRMYFKRQG